MSFPFYRQLDGMDCGPACLRMIAKYYGKQYSIQDLREKSCITRVGVSLLGVSEAAEKIGLRATALRPSFEYFVEQAKLPCVVHWNQNHFVVVYKIEKKKRIAKNAQYTFYIADPGYGLIKYDEQRFKKCWCSTIQGGIERGVIMTFAPTPQFYETKPVRTKKINLAYLLKYLHTYRKQLVQLLIGLLIGSIIQLFFPVLTQAIVDYGIGNLNLNFIHLILLAQLVLVLSSSLVDVIRRWILLHISTRVNVSLISDFLAKMMKLPMHFFDSKLVGDLIQRINDHERIESFLTRTVLNSLFSILTIFVFGVILFLYNVKIFIIMLTGNILYVVWISLFMKKRAELDHKNFAVMATYESDIIELIQGMQEIKLTGSEQQKRWRWENLQANIFRIKLQSLSLEQWQHVGSVLINEIKNILITILSATSVINGDITLGAMLSVQYIIGQMQSPVDQIVGVMRQMQDARISLSRLGEIHDRENEEKENTKYVQEFSDTQAILLDKVDFTYGSSKSKLVLKDLSLIIPSGKITAIVGLSGSGKTTMIKLMLGFYPPVNGEIYIGNIPLSKYSFKEWRKHCGVVMQDGFIFSDTIAGNIAAGDINIDKQRLKYAAQMANIEEFIQSLPLKYNTKIGGSGSGLSQGQKQRLLIARVIYKNPQYVFFDEATNALDAKNERQIVNNLNRFFENKTVVIVAHRLSTVRRADNIVVLDDGRITEQGTHEQLITKKGNYFDLVKDQLEIANS
ncbi:MAG: peptidase domain-containing ABC transporter [Prevotellaceae bacterium]|jgi:ATP-binding cassette subfamily B protein|nr:peptidase domain-containing ABC transporter [Prevotellaceae bacterium]